jgi:hypothetical protein
MKKVKFKNKEGNEILLDCTLQTGLISCNKKFFGNDYQIMTHVNKWLYQDELIFEYELENRKVTGKCNIFKSFFKVDNCFIFWKINI